MSVATAPPTASRPPFPVRRFSVDEYHRLVETGVLGTDDRVELLEGWIAPKMSHSPRHDAVVDLVNEALRRLLPKGWRTRIQSAATTATSEPEPDIAVVRGSARDYLTKHPGPQDTGLVVEVADSSLRLDRTSKLRIYAAAGMPEYWIINLADNQIEVFRTPTVANGQPLFADQVHYHSGDSIPLNLDGVTLGEIAADDLLP